MAAALQLNNGSTVFSGLGTSTFTVVTAGLYTVDFKSFVPYIASGSSADSTAAAPSALSVVVNLNGSPALTSGAPSATQPLVNGKVTMGCVAADVITVVLSSANAADNALNAVKSIINLYQGE